ncbi:BLUF domain-containing protein [Sphingomonas sp. GCM10030256]|uniref:BLUF domain-containing protein n=1 Tax=Sphingomonas sp. GCM10030256 TaxID=3273427 RepID=UPI0036116133
MELKALTYTSWAKPGIGDGDIEAILRSARTNNPLEGLTGVLIFNGSAFFQLLEGSEQAVNDMYERLSNDSRHWNMFVREQKVIAERAFPDWSMSYLRLENSEFIGEVEVERALRRAVPEPTRNIMRALTQSVTQER